MFYVIYGQAKAGWPAWTYIQQLCEDTGCNSEDLPEVMNDRENWREMVWDIRADGTTWWWMMIVYEHLMYISHIHIEALGWVSHFGGGADGKVSIENLYISLLVSKNLFFNSNVIKGFVPELRSRKCFLCFGIPMLSIYELWTFYVHFTYSCLAMLYYFQFPR